MSVILCILLAIHDLFGFCYYFCSFNWSKIDSNRVFSSNNESFSDIKFKDMFI